MTNGAMGNVTTIGLFDSGVGGLSVLRQLARLGRSVRFIYVGDTARCPYGGRPAADIAEFVVEITSWLVQEGATQIVMACNTSAALAGSALRRQFDTPVYDLIGPTARYAAGLGGPLAVMATENTIRSGAFAEAIAAHNPSLSLSGIACPDLVPLIESGLTGGPKVRAALLPYVRKLKLREVAAVVLGCTHYPFVAGEIADMLDGEVELIDPAALLLADLKEGAGTPSADESSLDARIAVTGRALAFEAAASACLGQTIGTVDGITVESLRAAADSWRVSRVAATTPTDAPHSVPSSVVDSLSTTGIVP